MSVGDRVRNPETKGYAAFEVTDETVTNGEMQVAMLVKAVGDDGSTSALATSANQDTLNTNLGAKADTAASTDTGTFSLIALVKRGLQSLTSIVAALAGTGSIKDNGPAWTSTYGLGSPSARFTSADASGSPASVTDAPTSGQKIVITDLIISVDTAMRVDFKEETSGTILLTLHFVDRGGVTQITPRGKLKLATANKKLQVQTDTAGNIAITPFYYSEA
jgi:hypothetical protein